MQRPPNRQLKRTQHLLSAVMGTDRKITKQFAKVLEALKAGRTDLPVEVPWYEGGGSQQILLQAVRADRVYFLNPARDASLPVGTELSGALPRRIEANGYESARLVDLERLFEAGKAGALI